MPEIKKINHVAIVVQDIDEALGFWRDQLGLELDHIEEVPSQASKVALYRSVAVKWSWCSRQTPKADLENTLKNAARVCTTFVLKWMTLERCWICLKKRRPADQ